MTKRREQSEGVELSRRSMTGALGTLGAMFGFGALAGCESSAGAAMGPSGTVAQALTDSAFRWCNTIGSPMAAGDLRGMVGSAAGEVVIAKGFWAEGDGGGGVFTWVADTTATSALDNWGLIVVPDGVSPGGYWKRLVEGTAWNVRWFGTKATGDTATPDDDTAAFQRAIDVFASPVIGNPNGGPRLFVPAGAYQIGDLRVDKQLHMFGAGVAFAGSTRLLVPMGKSGIIVDDYATCRAIASGGTLTSGGFSIIENLEIVGARSSLDGILVYAHGVVVRDICITAMGRNGITIRSDVDNPTGVPAVNANNWRIEGCRVDSSGNSPTRPAAMTDGGNGLYVESANSNAGMCISTDFSENYWYGVYDSSFLGNCYVSVHFAANGHPSGGTTVGGSVLVDDANNGSSFLGCYAEGGQTANIIVSNSTVVGGALAGSLGIADKPVQRVGSSRSRLHFIDDNTKGRYTVRIPEAGYGGGSAMLFEYEQFPDMWASGQIWALRRFKTGSDALSEATGASSYSSFDYHFDRCWGIQHVDGADPTKIPIGWTDAYHPHGAGHPFFRKATLNQKGHFSKRCDTTLAPGVNTVDVLTTGWLVPENGASLSVSFSVEVPASALSEADLRLGAYAIAVTGSGGSASGTLRVKVINGGASSVNATIIAHIESFKTWYTTY